MKSTFCCSILMFFICMSDGHSQTDAAFKNDTSHSSAGYVNPVQHIIDSVLKAGGKVVSIEAATTNDTNALIKNTNTLYVIDEQKLKALISGSEKKYTLIHCWASWCIPCRKEFPDFLKTLEAYNNVQVVLLSIDINTEEQQKKITNYVSTLNTSLPIYILPASDTGDFLNKSNAQTFIKPYSLAYEGAVPFNILIDNKTVHNLSEHNSYNEVLKRVIKQK